MKIFTTILLLYFTCSCSTHHVTSRIKYADQLSSQGALTKKIIKTNSFSLLTYSKISNANSALHIYIEGDGFAWRNRYTISHNPTPKNPVSLTLALADPHPNIVYIARPCQYVNLANEKKCTNIFWTNARFGESVIKATNQVIDHFVKTNQKQKIHLFGYSGGAAIAVLAAAKRNDVTLIGTVAGNLNHKELMKLHDVSPLNASLDAIDVADKVRNIKQFHLIGAKDRIVFPKIILSFAMRVNLMGGKAKFKIVNEANHSYHKWNEVWKKSLAAQTTSK
jgi:alpha/beta superfamily hydrolase